MPVRVFHSVLFFVTASLVAFSVGMLAAGGGPQQKLGPSGDQQGIAHPRTVRVILPDTLDGQSIPGRGSGFADRRRDLSPIYPVSPGSREEKSSSTVAAGAAPNQRARERDNEGPVTVSAPAHETAQTGDEQGFSDPATDVEVSAASDPRFFRHVATASRHARRGYYRHFYLAARRARPLYPFGAFARLSTSDHGR